MSALVLDAGALIAFERGERKIEVLVRQAIHRSVAIVVPAAVVGQVWRDGRKQARLARLLAKPEVTVVALDDTSARACGQLCGLRHTNVVDASVAVCALARKAPVATSDPKDLARLDPTLELIEI